MDRNKHILTMQSLLNNFLGFLLLSASAFLLRSNIASHSLLSPRAFFSLEKKGLKGMEAMILGLVVTLIIFFISVYCVLAAMGIFGPQAQAFITRLTFGLGEATPSFG